MGIILHYCFAFGTYRKNVELHRKTKAILQAANTYINSFYYNPVHINMKPKLNLNVFFLLRLLFCNGLEPK